MPIGEHLTPRPPPLLLLTRTRLLFPGLDREEEARLGRQEDPREGQLERGQQGAAGEQARGQSEH